MWWISLLVVVYVILLVFGFKSTWRFVVDTVLAGSSEIIGAIVLFVIIILVAGPIVGIVNLVKLAIKKYREREIDQG